MGSGVSMRDPTHVTPQINLCRHTFMAKVQFLLLFFGPDMGTEMGVAIYMYFQKIQQIILNPHIWIHGLTT